MCLSAVVIRQAVSGDDFITSCSFKMAGDESGATLGQPHLARQDLNSLVSVDFLSILWGLSLVCSRQFVFFFSKRCRTKAVVRMGTAHEPPPGTRRHGLPERAREGWRHYCSFSTLITLVFVVVFDQQMRLRDVIIIFDLMPLGFCSSVWFSCVDFIVSTVASLKLRDFLWKPDQIQIWSKL